jgi:DnaJ-class molecular chaperone
LTLKYHPDLNPEKNTNEQFMRIKDSYEFIRKNIQSRDKDSQNFEGRDPAADTEQNASDETSFSEFREYQRQSRK